MSTTTDNNTIEETVNAGNEEVKEENTIGNDDGVKEGDKGEEETVEKGDVEGKETDTENKTESDANNDGEQKNEDTNDATAAAAGNKEIVNDILGASDASQEEKKRKPRPIPKPQGPLLESWTKYLTEKNVEDKEFIEAAEPLLCEQLETTSMATIEKLNNVDINEQEDKIAFLKKTMQIIKEVPGLEKLKGKDDFAEEVQKELDDFIEKHGEKTVAELLEEVEIKDSYLKECLGLVSRVAKRVKGKLIGNALDEWEDFLALETFKDDNFVQEAVKMLSKVDQDAAVESIQKFRNIDISTIRNKKAYLSTIIKRVLEKNEQEKLKLQELDPTVQTALDDVITKHDIKGDEFRPKAELSLKAFSVEKSMEILQKFNEVDKTRIGNAVGFFMGIINRYKQYQKGADDPEARENAFEALPSYIQQKLSASFKSGEIKREDINSTCLELLGRLRPEDAIGATHRLLGSDLKTVRNITGFFIGIIRRYSNPNNNNNRRQYGDRRNDHNSYGRRDNHRGHNGGYNNRHKRRRGRSRSRSPAHRRQRQRRDDNYNNHGYNSNRGGGGYGRQQQQQRNVTYNMPNQMGGGGYGNNTTYNMPPQQHQQSMPMNMPPMGMPPGNDQSMQNSQYQQMPPAQNMQQQYPSGNQTYNMNPNYSQQQQSYPPQQNQSYGNNQGY